MTKVKICGLKDKKSVQAAIDAGSDYLGFVFAKSKRQVTPEIVVDLVKDCPNTVKTVGVFLNQSFEEIEAILKVVPLDYVQIHGEWDSQLRLSRPLIRAIAITEQERSDQGAEFLLFDAPVAGSGQKFDWSLLENVKLNQEFFLAGGLNAENVSEAIHRLRPYAVDVSSGVETDGVKDVQKIKEFIEVVKNVI